MIRLAWFAGALALAGCAAPVHPVATTVATPGMADPELALQNGMTKVTAEMAELGGVTPPSALPPTLPAPLQKTVSLTWNGPLDQAVSQVALSIGYTFYVTAPPNAQPLDVRISAVSLPAYQVLQMLGGQAGSLATVAVDPLHHQVEVIHHG